MSRLFFCLLLLSACQQATTPADPVEALISQSPLPGALTLDAPAMYAGETVDLTVTGAAPGERVYFALSHTGVSQQSICPAAINDCLNVTGPLTLLGSVIASGAGVAVLSVPVPPSALYASIFLQAAAPSGTSRVAHRFIEPPDSACGVGVAPPRCEPTHEEAGSWTCLSGQSCQDVYDVQLTAGTELMIDVTDVTGSSVVRLAVFPPGVGLNGNNLLTAGTFDSECEGQNQDVSTSVVATTTGTYRVAVGRDWGSSAGATGGYNLLLSADPGLDFLGRTVNDQNSQATGSRCGFLTTVNSDWTCLSGQSCQDVYDFAATAGDEITFTVGGLTGASVDLLALYAPGAALSTRNLLTGTTADRECGGQNVGDTTSTWIPHTTGTYRLAVGRDWGSSAGATGSYRLDVSSRAAPITLTQTVNNVASLQPATQCGFTWTESGSWVCGSGVSCQDVFDVPAVAGGSLTVTHGGLTGASVSRLAVFAPGVALSGANLLTGNTTDQECGGQLVTQIGGPVGTTDGTYRVGVGRDWGSSAGNTGNYTVSFAYTGGYPFITATAQDVASQASGTSCPP